MYHPELLWAERDGLCKTLCTQSALGKGEFLFCGCVNSSRWGGHLHLAFMSM